MVQRLPTLLLLASTPASADWTKGGFATLTFDTSDPGAVTYRLAYASSTGGAPIALPSNALATVGPAATSSGTDALGAYEALTLPVAGGALAVAYYAADDAFVWTRAPANDSLQTTWPSFDEATVPAASRCLYWGEHFFFPGGEPGCDGPQDGPQVLFEPPSNASIPSAALVVAPLDHFTTTFAVHCAAPGSARRGAQDGKLAGLDAAPCPAAADGVGVDASAAPGAANAAVTLARPGVTAALRAFGATTRRFHNGTKRRGEGVEGLAYWNDNQAGYSWWTVGDDQTVFGNPEAIYEKLKDGYEAAGVRVRSWEPDNNFNVSYFDPKNWKGLDLKQFNETLYPSGGAGFLEKMSKARPDEPVAMTFYTNGFTPDCARQDDWRMVKSNGGLEPHPNESFAFHADLLEYQRDAFGLEMLFTDFLCYRGPGMAAYGDVPAGEDGEHLWLAGIAEAAASLGVEVQFCMALAHQIMATVEWPAVTNARVNGDGGLAVQDLPLPAALAGALGLGWSKDNLRTADRCYVNATAADGSLLYDCAKDLNKGERVSGSFANQRQQTVLAALSLGPVGISDQLSARPEDPAAAITSNIALVNATCAANGRLLQPSYPLAPVERTVIGSGGAGDCFTTATHRSYTWGCGVHVWATHATVSGATFYAAFPFLAGKASPSTQNVTLYRADLEYLVDGANPDGDFAAVPRGTFADAALPAASYVVWRSNWLDSQNASDPCAGATGLRAASNTDDVFFDGVEVTANRDDYVLVNAAPLLGTAALLGEAGKVAAVSTYRFASIASDGTKITVGLRGDAGERVTLLFAWHASEAPDFACAAVSATIGADGTGTASFSA